MKSPAFAAAVAVLISTALLVLLLALTGSVNANPTSIDDRASPAVAPVIMQIDPSSAPNDLDTPIVITGTDFTAVPTITLGNFTLTDAGWVNSTTLTATVPWGINPGMYTLTVVNADGQSGDKPNAFTVTQGIGVWNAGELYGGWVEQVVLDPFDAQTVYATASGVGFFRSQDGGQHWEILRSGVGTINLSASPALPGRLYMQGTWDLRRSDDGGGSWIKLSPTFPVTDTPGVGCGGYRPLAHPILTNTVYVGLCSGFTPGPNGLLRSDDGGETWREVMDGLTDTQVTALTFHPTNPLTMYLGTASGRLFTSSNGGETWQYASRPLGWVESIAVDPFGEHTVWVNSIHGRDTPCETYKSSDASLTSWIKIDNPSSWPYFCRKVIFDPVNAGTIYIPFGHGFKTTNGGEDWVEFALGDDNSPLDFAIDSTDPDVVYMSDSVRGVYKSSDGGASWQASNVGLFAMIPDVIETRPDQPATIFALIANGLYKGTQGGAAWTTIFHTLSAIWDVCADPFVPGRLYVGALAGMCISEDAGETFTGCVQLEPPLQYAGHGIWPQVMQADPSQPGSLLVGVRFVTGTHFLDAGALYRSTDYGESWDLLGQTVGISVPQVIAYDPVSPTIVYLTTIGSGPMRSMDGGLSWEAIATGIPALRDVRALGVEPALPGRLLTMGMDVGVWISDDHGETWEKLDKPPELGINVADLLWLSGEPSVLYAATPTGLSRSLDRGYTWKRAPGALGYANVTALDAAQVDQRTILYVGTTGGSSAEAAQTMHVPAANQVTIGAGVYRFTTRQLYVYLPLIFKGYSR